AATWGGRTWGSAARRPTGPPPGAGWARRPTPSPGPWSRRRTGRRTGSRSRRPGPRGRTDPTGGSAVGRVVHVAGRGRHGAGRARRHDGDRPARGRGVLRRLVGFHLHHQHLGVALPHRRGGPVELVRTVGHRRHAGAG